MSVGKKAIIFGIVILIAILFSIPINAETQPEDQNLQEQLKEKILPPWPEGKKIPSLLKVVKRLEPDGTLGLFDWSSLIITLQSLSSTTFFSTISSKNTSVIIINEKTNIPPI